VTKADFYTGYEKMAEWLGSIYRDGMPDRIGEDIIFSVTIAQYERRVKTMLVKKKDSVLPGDGWPWLWDDSRMTDFSYFFFNEKVYASFMGGVLFDPILIKAGEDLNSSFIGFDPPEFPNMRKEMK
jgi:hypothetical protein